MSIFSFLFESKKSEYHLIQKELDNYFSIFERLSLILESGGHFGQADFVTNLADVLIKRDYKEFKKQINSVDMWGGSGAVWEVYFKNTIDYQEFYRIMLRLIDLMNQTKILGRGIKSRERIFQKELINSASR